MTQLPTPPLDDQAGVERTRLSAEITDEPNQLKCPNCTQRAFRINVDGEAKDGASVNNIECDGCHAMLVINAALSQPNPPSGDYEAGVERLRGSLLSLRSELADTTGRGGHGWEVIGEIDNVLAALKSHPPAGGEVERLREALRQIKARTYSSDRGCALGADSVAQISDIAMAALSTQEPDGGK